MAKPLPLTLGLSENIRTQALFDGSVRPEGIELECRSQFSEGYDNTGARHRWIIEGKIPGGECSTSSFILARNRGVPLKIFPIFISRQFRHRCIYCPANSSVREPADLKGKRVTVHRYNASTSVWVRGLLQNEYGVQPEEMDWYVAEDDVGEEALRPRPEGIRVQFISPPRTREHAIELLEEGEMDAALEPYPGLAKNAKLRRLFEDSSREEAEYFRRTQVIPIIHSLALREDLVAENPWIVGRLLKAFRQARALAANYMTEEQKKEDLWLQEVMGDDPFSYRLDNGARKSLETLIEYQVQQGLLDQRPRLEDLFFPESLTL